MNRTICRCNPPRCGASVVSTDLSILVGQRDNCVFDLSSGRGPMVPPGAIAELQGLLDDASAVFLSTGQPQVVNLSIGEFSITSPLRLPTGVTLRGVGQGLTILRRTDSPAIGLIDDPENAVVISQGMLDLTFDTVLTNAIAPGGNPWFGAGARQLSVATTVGLLPGDWIDVHGWETGVGSNPTSSPTNGSDIIVDELLLVTAAAAGVITLETPTAAHHVTVNGPGAVGDQLLAVRRVIPTFDNAIEDMTIDCGPGNVANGLTVDYGVRFNLSRVTFKNAKRLGYEFRKGCRDCVHVDTTIDSCNGGAGYLSCFSSRNVGLRTNPAGLRNHSVGVIRAGLWLYRMSNGISVSDFDLRHLCQGMWLQAFRVCSLVDGVLDDIYGMPKFLRDGLTGGVAIQMGTTPLDETAWSDGLVMQGITFRNVRMDPNAAVVGGRVLFWTVYYHDVYGIVSGNHNFDNDGVSPYSSSNGDDDFFMTGVGFQDAAGTFTSHRFKGVEYAFGINSCQGIRLQGWEATSAPGGGGTVPVVAMWFNQGIACQPEFVDCYFQGGIFFGPDFGTTSVDWEMSIKNHAFDAQKYALAILVQNKTGAVLTTGQIVELSPTPISPGAREVVAAGPGSTVGLMAAAMQLGFGIPINGYGFATPLPASEAKALASGTVNMGDLLEADGALALHSNAAVTLGAYAGRALEARSGAGSSLIRVG